MNLVRSEAGRRGPWHRAGAANCPAALCLAAGLCFLSAVSAQAQAQAQSASRVAAGEDAWNKAGCFECHGAAGEGGSGGEFPAGPSLRESKLDRAGLMETISCGRPGTPMPAWLDGAYAAHPCYGRPGGPAPAGVDLMPVLGADEIQALLDYLTAKIVGH
jgi:mono/diheme cytochrome c family protein